MSCFFFINNNKQSFLVGPIIWFMFWLWDKSLGPEHLNVGIRHDGFVLSFGVKRMWNSTLFVGTINQGWDLRARRRGADPDDILDFRVSFPGAARRWVKRRWAAGITRSQLLGPDWGRQSASAMFSFQRPTGCLDFLACVYKSIPNLCPQLPANIYLLYFSWFSYRWDRLVPCALWIIKHQHVR